MKILSLLERHKFKPLSDLDVTEWAVLKIACEKNKFNFLNLRHSEEIKDKLNKIDDETKRIKSFLRRSDAPGGN